MPAVRNTMSLIPYSHTVVPVPVCVPDACSSEFKQVKELGRGGFSIVFRATHRIDGCEYALKRTKSPVSDNKERNAWLQVRRGIVACICTAAVVGTYLPALLQVRAVSVKLAAQTKETSRAE